MKKILLCIFTLYITKLLFAQRSFEITGLPEGYTISESLRIALPLIIIGFFISYTFVWRKKDVNNVSRFSSNIGCIGILAMGVGIFFLFPLFTWVEFIFVNVLTFGFIIAIIGFFIYIIYSWLSKK